MVRVNISINNSLLQKIDKYKEMVDMSRSAFISEAVSHFFSEIDQKILQEKKFKAAREIEKISQRIGPKLSGWDSTREIRELRENRPKNLRDG